jgi:hypothetical protein
LSIIGASLGREARPLGAGVRSLVLTRPSVVVAGVAVPPLGSVHPATPVQIHSTLAAQVSVAMLADGPSAGIADEHRSRICSPSSEIA